MWRLVMIKMQRKPTTPGEMLKEEFLIPLKWTEETLAKQMDCDKNTVYQLINDEIPISSLLASKLASAFNTTAGFWLNIQKAADLYEKEKNKPFHDISLSRDRTL